MYLAAGSAVLLGFLSATINATSFEELAAEAANARRGNNIPGAIELYRQAVQLRGSWEEGWWFLGTLSYATYQYAGCENAFGQFVKLDEKRPLAWSLLGLCEFETGRNDSALEHLRQSISVPGLAPEVEAGVRFHYGLLLSKAGRFDQARRELARYSLGGAHEPMLIAGLGVNALHLQWLPKEVPSEQLDAVRKAGEAARLWILRQNDQAEAAFQQLIKLYPSVRGVHYAYGAYLSYSRPEDAMTEFRRELQLNPDNVGANAMLALLLLHAGDPSSALPYAKKAAANGPSEAPAEYAYGEVLLASGDLRPALANLEAAESLDPEALEYHMALAGAYSRAGRREEARRERRLSLDIAKGAQDLVMQSAANGSEVKTPAQAANNSVPVN